MRAFALLLIFCATIPVAAACPVDMDLDAISRAIRNARGCAAAAKIAEACAFGASGDVSLQNAVIAVCEPDFLPGLQRDQKRAYLRARSVCRTKYARMEGTMYVSAAASCEGQIARRYSIAARKTRKSPRP